jgi:hypothetical protein
MEFQIKIQSKIAPLDASSLATSLRRAINGLAGVSYTGQSSSKNKRVTSKHGCETLLVGLPANSVPAVMNLLKSHTERPGLGPITVEIATDGLKASFEPHALTRDQLRRLAGALSGP